MPLKHAAERREQRKSIELLTAIELAKEGPPRLETATRSECHCGMQPNRGIDVPEQNDQRIIAGILSLAEPRRPERTKRVDGREAKPLVLRIHEPHELDRCSRCARAPEQRGDR